MKLKHPWYYVLWFSLALLALLSILLTDVSSLLHIAALILTFLSILVLIKWTSAGFNVKKLTPLNLLTVAAMLGSFALVFLELQAPYDVPITSELKCEQYRVALAFDPSHNSLSGTQDIRLILDSSDDEDVENLRGRQQVLSDSSNKLMRSLSREGMTGWTITNVEVGEPDRQHSRKLTVDLRSNTIDVQTTRHGLLRYVSEIRTPVAVKGRGFNDSPKVEVILTAPEHSYLDHNLNGTFTETVLPNDEVGQRLLADRIVDPDNVIRLSYAPSSFQNEPMHKILEVSWWKVVLAIWAILTSVICLIVGIATDVLKDVLKPFFVRVLRRLHLSKKPNSDLAPPSPKSNPPKRVNGTDAQ